MFSEEERTHLRAELVAAAEADEMVTAAALVGSAARGREDQWSDIDLALRGAPGGQLADVARRWTDRMYGAHQATAHFDLWSGNTLYRVFLLPNTLQVDLSFWPADDFAPVGGPFRLLFGEAQPPVASNLRDPSAILGMAWMHALHARSSIARGRAHQALHMLNGMRDQLVTLACLRAGLPADQGRGVDDLPEDTRRRLTETVARNLDAAELARAFARLTDPLLSEAANVDAVSARTLAPVLDELVRTATGQLR